MSVLTLTDNTKRELACRTRRRLERARYSKYSAWPVRYARDHPLLREGSKMKCHTCQKPTLKCI